MNLDRVMIGIALPSGKKEDIASKIVADLLILDAELYMADDMPKVNSVSFSISPENDISIAPPTSIEEYIELVPEFNGGALIPLNQQWESSSEEYQHRTPSKNETESYQPVAQQKFQKQELRDKTGFYQEKTTMAKVRVQLWPEHLPYDHFKRKRAFLFC